MVMASSCHCGTFAIGPGPWTGTRWSIDLLLIRNVGVGAMSVCEGPPFPPLEGAGLRWDAPPRPPHLGDGPLVDRVELGGGDPRRGGAPVHDLGADGRHVVQEVLVHGAHAARPAAHLDHGSRGEHPKRGTGLRETQTRACDSVAVA